MPVDVPGIQRALPEGTLLAEFSLGGKGSFLWLITKDSSRLVDLPSSSDIEKHARAFLKLLHERPTSATLTNSLQQLHSKGRILFDVLFGDGFREISDASNLVIVPDGILFYLPFEALPLPDAKQLLVNLVSVKYAASATVFAQLSEMRDSLRPPLDLLAFGDPTFDKKKSARVLAENAVRSTGILVRSLEDIGHRIEPLPSTRREVYDIASQYSKDKVKLFLSDNATEARMKYENLRQFRFIHFATHGVLDEQVPSRSGLLLSFTNDSTEDGLLQMNEILNLEMNAELVVLSACETGLGKLFKGEGMVGLTRAFHYAGARTLIVSLWKVADVSTAELMSGLYSNLVKSRSPEQALREAKLKTLQSPVQLWRHPYHWAGFVVQ
jgi:CHAT domain-containing protein